MFKLIKLNDDKYALIGQDLDFEGSKVETIRKMIELIALHDPVEEEKEILYGFEAVEHDDYAEYGIFGRFIFSSNFKRETA